MDKYNKSLASKTRKGLDGQLFLKRLLATLLVVLTLFSAVPFALASDGNLTITVSKLEPKGKITWSNKEYPVYFVQVDGTNYGTVSVTSGEKITVDGSRKSFPSSMFFVDTDDKAQRWFTGAALSYDETDFRFSGASSYYDRYEKSITISGEVPAGNKMLLFRLPYGAGNRKSPWVTYAFLLISWSAGFQETDKTQLNDAIAKAPKDADKDTVYWHADDRWNGEIASKVGFWNEMLSALSKARTVSEDKFASEDAVKEATDNLSNAVANLIKAENNNTTLLYEELLNEPNKADYTPKSWSAYTKVRDRAEAMMSTMFDEEGKPTSANTSAGGKQKELETLAAELTTAREALDKRAALVNPDAAKNAELLIDAIEELQTRYADADLSDYTAPSVRKLQEELASADALTKVVTAYSSIGSKELTSLQTALRNLRMAALGLETEQTGQIHVELSVLDAADISNKKVGDSQALRNPNTRTATLELPANASAYDLLHAKLETGGTYYTQSNTDSVALVFLNGELLYNPSFGHDYPPIKSFKLFPFGISTSE